MARQPGKDSVTSRSTSPFAVLTTPPTALRWWRGPMVRDGDYAKLQPGKDWVEYRPLEKPAEQIAQDIQTVNTADDALRFLRSYGPLTFQWIDQHGDLRPALNARGGPPVVPDDTVVSVTEVLTHATKVRAYLQLAAKLSAAGSGNHSAFRWCKKHATALYDARRDTEFLSDLSQHLATAVSHELDYGSAAEPTIYSPRAGKFAISIRPSSLLGVVYFGVALLLTKQRLATCERCKCVFAKDDERQRFCTKSCGTSARVAKMRKKDKQ